MHARVTNLGVISNTELKFAKHIIVVVINSILQMKTIAKSSGVIVLYNLQCENHADE